MTDKTDPIMKSQENCGVCGSPLIYGTEDVLIDCVYCGKKHKARIYCPEGHYVCDVCHGRKAIEVLRQVLDLTTSANPSEILETVMSHPSVPMHGPEHHVFVPAIITAAVKNTGQPVPEQVVEKAISRGSEVPGGWCGLYGACGAGIGVGIAVSVLTGATPLTGPTRALANEATALALTGMLDGHPRCCKRASRKALEIATEFLETRLGISLEKGNDVKCVYVPRNQECIHEDCPYYGES